MRTRSMMFLVGVIVGGVGFGWLGLETPRGATTELTGADYAEIERLYGLYNQGSDFRDADLWLSAFADDAVFATGVGEMRGQAALRKGREERYQGQTGDNGRRHWNSSYRITPSSAGADGRVYWMLIDVSSGQPQQVASGYYEDVYEKTSDGWRIKHRTLRPDRG